MNIVIPMAGEGKRFAEAGFADPKPFIDVDGQPMITRVLTNLPVRSESVVTFVVRAEHRERLQKLLTTRSISSRVMNWRIVEVNGTTSGAAETVLHGIKDLDRSKPLLVANSDQWVDWHPGHFLSVMKRRDADGGIPTFAATDSKWSYVALDEKGVVTRVAEKEAISQWATVGIYWWRKTGYAASAIDKMMADESTKVNGEYYLCPAYNQMVEDFRVMHYPVAAMYGMGTPDDLQDTLIESPW